MNSMRHFNGADFILRAIKYKGRVGNSFLIMNGQHAKFLSVIFAVEKIFDPPGLGC